MARAKVVITDTLFPTTDPEHEVLSEVADIVLSPSGDAATLAPLVADADGVINCFAQLSPDLVRGMSKCKIIARYGIGVDTIPVDVATESGIMVTNVPDYCINEVADHAMALILSLARKLARATRLSAEGQWGIKGLRPVHRLQGQTLSLLGFGRIARALAARATSFGLRIVAYDPYVPEETIRSSGVEPIGFEDALREADYLSVHIPLTSETRHIIGTPELELIKPTAYLINASRGGLVDTDALIDALENHKLAGAGLDVLEEEPPARDLRLLELDNVLVTPHSGFYSEEALTESQYRAAEEVARALRGERPNSLVNASGLGR